MRFLLYAGLLWLSLSTGCATILRGSTQTIPVHTTPAAVQISVPSGMIYTTPTTLELERGEEYVLEFTKEGYESSRIAITKHISGGYILLDALFTGLLGVVVDAVTGAWYNLKPEAVTISLARTAAVPGPDSIEIAIEGGESRGELEVTSSEPGVHIRVIPAR